MDQNLYTEGDRVIVNTAFGPRTGTATGKQDFGKVAVNLDGTDPGRTTYVAPNKVQPLFSN